MPWPVVSNAILISDRKPLVLYASDPTESCVDDLGEVATIGSRSSRFPQPLRNGEQVMRKKSG